MGIKRDKHERNTIENTIESLSKRHNTPIFMFYVLLALYFLATFLVSSSAGADGALNIGNLSLPTYTLAGVFSALANICLMLLAILYDRVGFFTSFVVLVVQIPVILMGVARGNITSIPGIFSNILALVAIGVIHLKNVDMKKYQDTLRHQAVTDMLTGLPNGFAGTELLVDLVRRKERFALVAIDINGFKNINDTMGFSFGDKVLKEVASKWRTVADSGVTGTNDFIIRSNGDEFGLMIRGYKTEEDVLNTIREYEAVLEKRLTVEDYDFFINASFGYSLYPEDADNIDSLLSYATAAMKEIKRANSSNHILHFTPDLLRTEKTLEVENKIRYALENDLIFCNLQPQYDMDHKLRGFEALARMKDKDGTVISPADFIPVAEEVGLIDKIDSHVFRIAAKFLGDQVKKSGTKATMSVNVSARHMMKNDFVQEVKDIIASSGVPAGQIEIEITESVMIDSAEKALGVIDELKAFGVMIAIDDFGTGYSSLSYLNKFPANLLKVDKSFIDRMNLSDSSKQYVAAIISIGHILGFEVISEGAEEEEQLITLREIGCDYIQGFVWGRPLPLEEAEKIVSAA